MAKRKMTNYLAVAIAEGFCEGEGASEAEQIEAWQHIKDKQLYLHLQGFFGRTVEQLTKAGVLS